MANKTVPENDSCIFCKIVAGQIPCEKLYEDEAVLSFLDVGPLSKGHALVIPKGHWEKMDCVPAQVSSAIGRILPVLSRSICSAVGADDWNILQNNGRLAHQEVDHVHFHIIPRTDSAGLGINWSPKKIDKKNMATLGEMIRNKIER